MPCHASATVLSVPRGGRGRGNGRERGYMPGQNPPGSGTGSGSGSGWRKYLLGGKRAARRPRVARNELGAFVGRGEAKSSRTVPIAGCGRHRLHSSAFAFAFAFRLRLRLHERTIALRFRSFSRRRRCSLGPNMTRPWAMSRRPVGSMYPHYTVTGG